MAPFAMFLTMPLLYIALEKKCQQEKFLKLKLISIWLLCQTYISLNYKYRIPLGIVIGALLIVNNKVNKQSKLSALLVGVVSFSVSVGINLIYKV